MVGQAGRKADGRAGRQLGGSRQVSLSGEYLGNCLKYFNDAGKNYRMGRRRVQSARMTTLSHFLLFQLFPLLIDCVGV